MAADPDRVAVARDRYLGLSVDACRIGHADQEPVDGCIQKTPHPVARGNNSQWAAVAAFLAEMHGPVPGMNLPGRCHRSILVLGRHVGHALAIEDVQKCAGSANRGMVAGMKGLVDNSVVGHDLPAFLSFGSGLLNRVLGTAVYPDSTGFEQFPSQGLEAVAYIRVVAASGLHIGLVGGQVAVASVHTVDMENRCSQEPRLPDDHGLTADTQP